MLCHLFWNCISFAFGQVDWDQLIAYTTHFKHISFSYLFFSLSISNISTQQTNELILMIICNKTKGLSTFFFIRFIFQAEHFMNEIFVFRLVYRHRLLFTHFLKIGIHIFSSWYSLFLLLSNSHSFSLQISINTKNKTV